jgi:hypothetical protein
MSGCLQHSMAIAKGNRKYNGKKEIPKEKEEGE